MVQLLGYLFYTTFLVAYIMGTDWSIPAKVIPCIILTVVPLIDKLHSWIKESVCIRLTYIAVRELSQVLSSEEFRKIVISCDKLFSIRSEKDWNEYIQQLNLYMKKNCALETRKKIVAVMNQMPELFTKEYAVKANSIRYYLHMNSHSILMRYLTFGLFQDQNNIQENQKNLYMFLYLLPCIMAILFALSREPILLLITGLSFLVVCYIHKRIDQKAAGLRILLGFNWLLLLLVLSNAPRFIYHSDFYEQSIIYMLVFMQLMILLTGIWITNTVWTSTAIEIDNKGKYIANSKLDVLLLTKVLSILRYIWIWLTFFAIIVSIIFFYAFIYSTKFHIYSLENSIFLSIDIYFNGNIPTLVGQYSYVYFYMENIVSFLINTLYLANIVRLIFEPKLVKKQSC